MKTVATISSCCLIMLYKRTIDSFACPEKILGKNYKVLLQNISFDTEILQTAVNDISLCSENPYLSIDIAETFFHGGIKKDNM